MCDCVKNVNAELAKHNTRLATGIYLLPNAVKRVHIATEKINSKMRVGPIHLTSGFCPFCGAEYEPEPQP